MTAPSYGDESRRPVFSGTRRVPGLYERTVASGATVYEVRARLGGKVRRHSLTAGTKTDAIAELRALQTDYSRGEAHRSSAAAVTLDELAGDYLAHLEARVGHRDARRRYSARTVALYRQRIEAHILPTLGRRSADEITVVDVRRLVDVLGAKRIKRGDKRVGLSPSTITGTVNILSGLLRFGMKAGVVERNPVRDLDRDDRPGVARQSEPRYLTALEVELLLGTMGDTFRPIAATCAYGALRVSEAIGLRWRDVDFKGHTLTVSGQLGAERVRVPVKSEASAATVPLLPALARELTEHRSRQAGRDLRLVHADALVFTTSMGAAQSRRNVLRAVNAAGVAAGLQPEGREPVGPHDLRHSYVAGALAAGASMAETAALARHASARVTAAVYAGITDDGRATAAAKLVDAGFGS